MDFKKIVFSKTTANVVGPTSVDRSTNPLGKTSQVETDVLK